MKGKPPPVAEVDTITVSQYQHAAPTTTTTDQLRISTKVIGVHNATIIRPCVLTHVAIIYDCCIMRSNGVHADPDLMSSCRFATFQIMVLLIITVAF